MWIAARPLGPPDIETTGPAHLTYKNELIIILVPCVNCLLGSLGISKSISLIAPVATPTPYQLYIPEKHSAIGFDNKL